jgi:zinc protease
MIYQIKAWMMKCLFALVFFSVQFSFGQLNLSDTLPLDPMVKMGKLPNGLTYYIRQNKKPEQKVELRLVVNTGSIMEDEDQQGLAHFAEHMAFNGTTHFKKNDIVSFLQSIGVGFGNDLNAYTSFNETVYILPIPTDKRNNLDKGFQILEDWAHNVNYT